MSVYLELKCPVFAILLLGFGSFITQSKRSLSPKSDGNYGRPLDLTQCKKREKNCQVMQLASFRTSEACRWFLFTTTLVFWRKTSSFGQFHMAVKVGKEGSSLSNSLHIFPSECLDGKKYRRNLMVP